MTSQTETPGALWGLIQAWMDSMRYPPTQRQLADRIGVSPSAVTDWKYGRGFPTPDNVQKIAAEISKPYETVLDAVLKDRGYRVERSPAPGPRERGVS
ncbi:hypothetical protein CFH99_07985 [Nocardioides aromaticivorans]|uniref:HTH cro/C1-type domain-containing protein n=1 Tax=Nocardioides aromaticivorans TaxID=200618 RepID=A0ABX7PIC4_9ACTN|nr:helix-turn-helix transcriptional regulator [Nocardioides aromaticivorans]QSR25561.1 hypothetical protein CFH99_07985 [Nocardioides aromaticivorans]